MSEPSVITSIDQTGIARVTLNRPAVRNAFDEEMIGNICDTIGQLSNNEEVRAIIITGNGKAFSGGADLNMMIRVADYSQSENRDDARRLAHMLESIYNSPKPTIALVNGAAMGGALGIIAACDIAIASEDAFFALTEVRVGLIPAVISPFVIETIGVRQARRFFLTGERIDAATARQIGLVHKVCMNIHLEETLAQTLNDLLSGAPEAIKDSKDLIRAVAFRPIGKETCEETANRIAGRRASKEGREGITAFLEKRKPNWQRD